MKTKIYQCFYKKDQENLWDKSFEKLDNTQNLKPNLREYYINTLCYEQATKENLDLWGSFSCFYKSKINISGNEILNKIKQNPDNDIYFFNPYFTHSLCHYNIWENGKYMHSNMVIILEKLFPALNINLKYLYEPMNTDEMFYCCYCVANKKFWDGYFEIFSRYFDALNNIDEDTKKLHNASAGYYKDHSLNYFPFIHERFFSSYIKMNNFKVFAFHNDDKRSWNNRDKEHDQLRKDAILEKNKSKLREWMNKKQAYYGIGNDLPNYFYEKIDW